MTPCRPPCLGLGKVGHNLETHLLFSQTRGPVSGMYCVVWRGVLSHRGTLAFWDPGNLTYPVTKGGQELFLYEVCLRFVSLFCCIVL